MKTFCFWLLATLMLATPGFADIVHDEAVDGDLSNNNLAPQVLAFNNGSNEIHGSSTFDPLDRDFWTITIDPGFQLTSIELQLYDSIQDQSWMAVELGSQITSLTDPANLLGSALIGFDPGAQQGDNVLDDLGNAVFGGAGFTGALGPGTYTFWFQETGADINYEFNFVISAAVPEPSSLPLMMALACGAFVRSRRS
jgi:hypothetical protein